MNRIRVAVLLGALALLPAAAQAQTTITACYVPKSGSVYRVKVEGAPAKCAKSHVEFSWETGVSGWGSPNTHSELVTIQPGELAYHGVTCPQGTVPLSGGFIVQDPENSGVIVTASYYQPIGNAWSVTGVNKGAAPASMVVHAYCATYPQ